MSSRYLNFDNFKRHLDKPRKEQEDFASLLYDPLSSPKQYNVAKLILEEIYKYGAINYKKLVQTIVNIGYSESVYYDVLRKLKKFGLIHKKDKKYKLFSGFSKALHIYVEQWNQMIKTAEVKEKEIKVTSG
jgi:Fe2+ or Zn2+ uptake regulation protein